MRNTLLDLSEKIEPRVVDAVAAVSAAAEQLGIPCFVIGAAAGGSRSADEILSLLQAVARGFSEIAERA
jgi:hypothetical protein